MTILKVNGAKKKYGKPNKSGFNLSIDNFEIHKGESVALLGPNGSGKTTFLKVILDLLHLDRGYVEIFGLNHRKVNSRKMLGYLPENFSFPENFSLKEVLKVLGSIGKYNIDDIDQKIEKYSKKFGINYLDIKIKNLSKGMIQTGALLHTFLGNKSLYILDEPFNGLDVVQKDNFLNFLKEKKKEDNISFLVTTHTFSDIEKICDTIYLVSEGEFIDSKSKSEIIRSNYSLKEYYLSHFK